MSLFVLETIVDGGGYNAYIDIKHIILVNFTNSSSTDLDTQLMQLKRCDGEWNNYQNALYGKELSRHNVVFYV